MTSTPGPHPPGSAASPPVAVSRAVATHALVLLAFAILSVLLTWPLLPNLATHLPGSGLDDNAGFLWDFWLFRRSLADESADMLFTTAAFHPDGINLALHTHLLLNAFVGGALLGWAPLPVALNLTLLAACALNGFSTYLLAYRLTAHRTGALVAGLFFAASPLFVSHFFGHFNRYTAWPLVFFVRACLISLEAPSVRTAALVGAWLAAVAYTDYYYFVYALVFGATALFCTWFDVDLIRRAGRWSRLDATLLILAAVAAAIALVVHLTGGLVWTSEPFAFSLRSGRNVRAAAAGLALWWLWRRRPLSVVALRPRLTIPSALLRSVAVSLATCALLLMPVLISAFTLWREGQYVTQSYVWRNSPPGIDIGGMLMGNVFNTWWGAGVARVYGALGIDSLAPQAWLGIVPLVLIVTWRAWMAERAARTWLLLGCVFLVWSAGPFLRVFGIDTGLPLPQVLLRYVPVVSNARIPPHVGVLVYLAVATLLAFAIARWPFGRARIAGGAIALAIFVDFMAAPRPMIALERPPIFERLAQRPGGAVLDVPVGIRDGFGAEGRFEPAVFLHQTIHGKPIVTGYVSRLPPAVRQRYHDSPVMRTLFALSSEASLPADAPEPTAGALELASRWNVRYIVVDLRSAPPPAQRFIEAIGAPLIDRDAFRRVYELPSPP